MAEQQETITIDDAEMFQSAMAEPKQTDEERARDDKGRFVAAETEAQPEATAQPEKVEQPAQQEQPKTEQPKTEQSDDGQVPSWRMREIREDRDAQAKRADEVQRQLLQTQAQVQAFQEQLQKFQAPKQEPVDFFADPDRAIKQQLTPIQQEFQSFMSEVRLNNSRTMAVVQHGVEAVAEMETAIADAMSKNHPEMAQLAAQMRSSNDPAGEAMKWFKREKLLQVTGGDPDAYKAKVLEEALKDPKFMEKALESARTQAGAKPGSTVINLPPSLNKLPSAGQSGSADDGDVSDAGLFRHAMSSKRR